MHGPNKDSQRSKSNERGIITSQSDDSKIPQVAEEEKIKLELMAIRQNLKTLSRLLMVFIGQEKFSKFDIIEDGTTLELRTDDSDEEEESDELPLSLINPFPQGWLT